MQYFRPQFNWLSAVQSYLNHILHKRLKKTLQDRMVPLSLSSNYSSKYCECTFIIVYSTHPTLDKNYTRNNYRQTLQFLEKK